MGLRLLTLPPLNAGVSMIREPTVSSPMAVSRTPTTNGTRLSPGEEDSAVTAQGARRRRAAERTNPSPTPVWLQSRSCAGGLARVC